MWLMMMSLQICAYAHSCPPSLGYIVHLQGSTLKEATKINLSLSALGNVISALTNPK